MNTDDYARGAVPEAEGTSGLHLALIIIGGTIGFAVYVVAAQIGGSLGYTGSALAFGLGSLILGVMGAITSFVGARSRLSTYLLVEFAFGRSGARLVNAVIAISLIGWFGVISNTLGIAAQQMLLEETGVLVSPYLTVSIACALMIAITAMGFTGIDRLALALVPLMLIFMAVAAFKAIANSSGVPLEATQAFTLPTAISAVVGTYIVGVIIQPDYSRFAISTRHAIWSVFIALGMVFPLVQFFSAIPAIALGEPEVVKVMAALGFLIPGFLLLFFGAWGSNVLCLYSAGLSIATLLERIKLYHIIIGLGAIGTGLAFIPVQTYLVGFLVVLGVTIPPIGAIYVIECAIIRGFDLQLGDIETSAGIRWTAICAWLGGALAGFLSDQTSYSAVGVAALDSLLAASALFAVLEHRRLRAAVPLRA